MQDLRLVSSRAEAAINAAPAEPPLHYFHDEFHSPQAASTQAWRALSALRTAACRRVLGENAPDTLTSETELAFALSQSGEHASAVGLQERVLAARLGAHGQGHAEALSARMALARLQRAAGDLDAARREAARALEAAAVNFGLAHTIALDAAGLLAAIHCDCGEFVRAEALAARTLAMVEPLLAPSHPLALAALKACARAAAAQGRSDAALACYRRLFDARLRDGGPDSPETLRRMNDLGLAVAACGEEEGAAALLDRAATGLERLLGRAHADARHCRCNHARIAAVLRQAPPARRARLQLV